MNPHNAGDHEQSVNQEEVEGAQGPVQPDELPSTSRGECGGGESGTSPHHDMPNTVGRPISRWPAPMTDQIDENDPVLGEAEEYVEACHYARLKALEEAIENEEMAAHLDAQGDGEEIPANDQGDPEERRSSKMESARVHSRNKELASYVKKKRREAIQEARAAARTAAIAQTAKAEAALSSWRTEKSEEEDERQDKTPRQESLEHLKQFV